MAENLELVVLARLSQKAKDVVEVSGDDWFFVDDAPIEVKKGKYGEYEIVEITDQFQNNHLAIPQGWQTICRIIGIDKEKLPEKHAWYANETSIKIPL